MNVPRECSACGRDLSSDTVLEGYCSACLLELGLPSPGQEPDAQPSAAPGEATQTLQPPQVSPRLIGPYRILQKLGEGGMGEVYEAEQEHPIRRKVALKLIKAGMDTKQVVARFESERQALALMDHACIARVFDAGATEQGRPYFVMEYVPGEPITSYCDRHTLTTNQRLALFRQVCAGVQHAHQKGIIHRDIKPSNVLVEVQDDAPVPKIIDFGVAKATGQRLTEKTMFTALGALVGTPEYMSPEQAEMTGLDVDTRTDVYSLGVLLYELLVGALPFDSQELRRAAFDEICRKIREDEPSKPSTRLSSLGDASRECAKHRHTDPGSLVRELRGDLDWITMKALAKDRTRRYGSPNELAADIERHLNDEPVIAGPPSTAYRMRKFVRRHKGGVGFLVVVLVFLLTLSITMTVQARRIAKERDRANQAATTAEQVADFLVDMFEFSDTHLKGQTITARDILDRGAERIETELQEQPLVKARMMATIGGVYLGLRYLAEARPHLEEALEIRRRLLGEDHAEVAKSMVDLGGLYSLDYEDDEALRLYRRALAIRQKVLGPEHPDVAAILATLAWYEDDEKAIEMYQRSLAMREKALGPDDPDAAWILQNLGYKYERRRDFEKARECYQRAMAIWDKSLGPDQHNLAPVQRLGVIAQKQGNFKSAWEHYRRCASESKRIHGLTYPGTAASLWTIGRLFTEGGQYSKAQDYFRLSIDLKTSRDGPDDAGQVTVLKSLAQVQWRTGDYDDAKDSYESAARIMEERFGLDDSRVGSILNSLGQLHSDFGYYETAREVLERGLESYRQAHGPEHDDVAWNLINLAVATAGTGDHETALELMERGMTMREKLLGPDHEWVAWGLAEYANLLRDTGDHAGAARLAERALSIREEALGPDHPDVVKTLWQLASLRLRQGDPSRAEPLFERALEIKRETLGEDSVGYVYDEACYHALHGDRDKALASLKVAAELGYASEWPARDRDLDFLRGDPEFEALLAEILARPRNDLAAVPEGEIVFPMTPQQLAEADRLLAEWKQELEHEALRAGS